MELSPLANLLITELDKETAENHDKKLSVNPVVSEVATWYEKFRNAMDYREDDVLLRAAIERILKRRLLLGGNGKLIALPLVRELLWARYIPESSMPESLVLEVEKFIDLYLKLQTKINDLHRISRSKVSEWIYQLMSADIAHVLNPRREKELIANFMYQTFREKLTIADDTGETRDVQVYIAVRRTFAKEDLALLRYRLFQQIFGPLDENNVDKIAVEFIVAYKEIENQLNYPIKDRIFNYIKNQTIPFFILEDVFKNYQGRIKSLVINPEEFNVSVLNSCMQQYQGIKAKVRRAIIRGVIFIFVTKAIFALAVEGTYENLVFGKIMWNSMALNTAIPPLLMVFVGLMIKTPGKDNSIKILERIHAIVYNTNPYLLPSIVLKKAPPKMNPLLNFVFIFLWVVAIVITLGSIVFVLHTLNFNAVSQAVFIFFLLIVSFISFRINQTAHMYTVSEGKQNLKSVAVDFLFMPVVHLGRNLTENISKLNLFLFVFDYIIEAPFKGIFAFFEEWFLYLRTQREKLG